MLLKSCKVCERVQLTRPKVSVFRIAKSFESLLNHCKMSGIQLRIKLCLYWCFCCSYFWNLGRGEDRFTVSNAFAFMEGPLQYLLVVSKDEWWWNEAFLFPICEILHPFQASEKRKGEDPTDPTLLYVYKFIVCKEVASLQWCWLGGSVLLLVLLKCVIYFVAATDNRKKKTKNNLERPPYFFLFPLV